MIKRTSTEEYIKMNDIDKAELCKGQYLDMVGILIDCNEADYLTNYITLIVLINNGLITFREIDLSEIMGRVNKYIYLDSIVKIGRVRPKQILHKFILYAYQDKNESGCKNFVFIPTDSQKVYVFTITEIGAGILKEECSPIYFNGYFSKNVHSELRDEINKIITMISPYKEYTIKSTYELREKMNRLF